MNIFVELSIEVVKLFSKLLLKPSREIARVVKIYDTMHKVLETTDVERMLILKAHNGGGLIRPSTPLYVSVLYEDYDNPFTSVKETYQKYMIDEHYLRTLNDLCMDKKVVVVTEALPASMLKDIYQGEGVEYSEIHLLGQDRKNLYFCSVASSKKENLVSSPKQKLAIETAVNTIRNSII